MAKLREYFTKLSSNSATGKSARAAMLVFAIRIFSAGLAFVLQVFLARWMGTYQYGIFVLVWVVALIAGGLSCVGLQTTVIRFITQYRSTKDRARLFGIMVAAPAIAVGVSLIVAIVGYGILLNYDTLLTEHYALPFYLVLISLPILTLEAIQDGVARSFDLPITAIGPAFIIRPLLIILMMAMAYASGFAPTAVTAIISAIAACFIATTIQSIALWRKVLNIVGEEFRSHQTSLKNDNPKFRFEVQSWMVVALPVFMAGSFSHLLTGMDVILVGYFIDPQNVAVYFAALKILALVYFVHFALRAVSAHHFSKYYSENDIAGLSSYARKITQWTFWPSLVLAVLMVMAGKFLLSFFGADFVDGQTLLFILALGLVSRAMVGPAESLLSMTGQQNITVLVLAATLLCNLILNIALIPPFGVAGAAIATSIAMVFESVALYIAVNRKLGLHIFVFGGDGLPLRERPVT